MHRTASVALALLVLSLTACAPLSGDITVSRYPPPSYGPSYVYSYADGSCWADDVWYPACPWLAGAEYGYYYRYGGTYYREPHVVWRYRVHAPPPWQWRSRHHRHHYAVPPPRHRRH